MADYLLERDTTWEAHGIDPRSVDPNLRLVASLIDAQDYDQLFRRTGLRLGDGGTLKNPALPLFLSLESGKGKEILENLTTQIDGVGLSLRISPLTLALFERYPGLTVATARFGWPQNVLMGQNGKEDLSDFRTAIAHVIKTKGVRRVAVPSPLQPCLDESVADLEMPPGRKYKGRTLDGAGVMIGIIDDGCALAHRNFLVPGANETRVLHLWDQSGTPNTNTGWKQPRARDGSLLDGRVLDKAAIDAALAKSQGTNRLILEERFYEYLDYDPGSDSHGTHVLDIAAGNGASLAGAKGVAPAADIVFVQLPRDSVEEGGPVLEHHILEGVQFIIDRADDLKKPVVVNISYGGYSGPHDGTSELASGIDALLQGRTDSAVVVSAGNGFEADCHAQQSIEAGADAKPLHWNLNAEDPTANQVEIWYEPDARLELSLTPPGAHAPLQPPVRLNDAFILHRGSEILGWIENKPSQLGRQSNVIRIQLNATVGEDGSSVGGMPVPPPTQPPALTAPVPSGTWTLGLHNAGGGPSSFHAWIERDDLRRFGDPRRQQSHFDEDEAHAACTIADLATGKLSIAVGAHNTATGEMCRYSACGPTRDGRPKPEVTAPAEELPTGGGILCASSRSAMPSRFNGTSASAPHVAGVVALLIQYNRAINGSPLTVADIRQAIMDGATHAQTQPPPPTRTLAPNRYQDADPHCPAGEHQADFFPDLVGKGKVNLPGTLP